MNALLPKINNPELYMDYAQIIHQSADKYTIQTNHGTQKAKPAASCLLKPMPGDLVLISQDQNNLCYILAVLERKNQTNEISLQGDLNLKITNGHLNLTSDEQINLASPNLEINAKQATTKIEQLNHSGSLLQAQIKRLKILAQKADTIYEKLVQRMTSSYRYIKEHDETQTASSRIIVEGTLAMQTQNTLHTAEKHIKMDAEQIHLG